MDRQSFVAEPKLLLSKTLFVFVIHLLLFPETSAHTSYPVIFMLGVAESGSVLSILPH